MTRHARISLSFIIMSGLALILAMACLISGPVDIPTSEVMTALSGGECSRFTWTNIVTQLRLPMMVTAAVSGMALAIAGLLMQTAFDNPLAGPSIMGVSTGASLGVALAVIIIGSSTVSILAGALLGAALIIMILSLLSSMVRSTIMLLIAGIMISYLTSSAISITNYVATADSLQTFVVWGLGSFTGVDCNILLTYSMLCLIPVLASCLFTKPLDALLLGDLYATNLGVNVMSTRTWLLIIAGLLTSIVTAWCGPIAFIGLAVPHIARMTSGSSSHHILIPLTALAGIVTGLLALWMSLIPSGYGQLPINAITPVIGVPIVIYIIINRRRLAYFN